jgi:flagella basal body P-ring formation protein FlgA
MARARHIALFALAFAALLATGASAERPGRALRSGELRALATAAIARVLPPGQVIEDLAELRPLAAARDDVEVDASFPGGEAFRRHAAIALEWRAGGETLRREQVRATLALDLDLPVAARPIPKGEIIDGDAVRMSRVRFTERPGDLALAIGDAVGRAARRDFAVDEPFGRAELERVTVVRRGERIAVDAAFGRVLVTTAAIAHEDGSVGDRISAELPATERAVTVEITARGRGRVVR